MASLRFLLAAVAVKATSAAAAPPPLPDYALAYAPLSYLHSGESWFPSDVATHLQYTIPELDGFKPVAGLETAGSVTLETLATAFDDTDSSSTIYLASANDTTASPQAAWLTSDYGRPDGNGRSAAPGTIVAVQKNASWVDVFYFYFYSFNYGGKVLDINFDDHVGDWEHTMIRFVNESPVAMYFSQHSSGSAYRWDVLQHQGRRPVTYIAHGGHANYATAGIQQYTIAAGIITDQTDAGTLWDMTLNYRGYWFRNETEEFSSSSSGSASSSSSSGSASGNTSTLPPSSWLTWLGHWGDQQYPLTHPKQYCLFDECHFTTGPTGPLAKNLGRTAMCQHESSSSCKVYTSINDLTRQSKRWLKGSWGRRLARQLGSRTQVGRVSDGQVDL